VEVVFGADPQRPNSPNRDRVYELREDPSSTVTVTVRQSVRADGESYVGAFTAPEIPRDPDAPTARAFYEGSLALTANPDGNAAVVDGESFEGVLGTTELIFEIRFAFGENEPRDCARVLPFRYTIKRSDGQIVGRQPYWLVVRPPAMPLGSTIWCAPPGSCI
jgi:hypothetical protein